MNFPTTMYTLKPLVYFQNTDVDIIPTMYIMKNICSSNFRAFEGKEEGEDGKSVPNILEQVNTLLKKPISEVEVLRKRQEGILTQLTYLKEQMLALRDELSKKGSSPLPSQASNKINVQHDQSVKTEKIYWDGVTDEIVVFASPEWPPYSLLAVNQLWPEVLRLNVSCHTHSSVSSLPPHLAAFSSLGLTSHSQPNLSIRLIWKTMGSDCEIIFSPVSHSPIRGEVNLLRYLHRTISPACDLVTEIKQESILDLCHRLRHVQAVQDKKLLVESVSARLGKSSWLGGDNMTIADVAAWSTVRSLSDCQLSQNMRQWQSRCSAVARVQAA